MKGDLNLVTDSNVLLVSVKKLPETISKKWNINAQGCGGLLTWLPANRRNNSILQKIMIIDLCDDVGDYCVVNSICLATIASDARRNVWEKHFEFFAARSQQRKGCDPI
jgi:hypothetical protein